MKSTHQTTKTSISKATSGLKTALITGLSLCVLAGAPAFASKHCKDVYLKITNNTNHPIKVIDLDYYDPAAKKWRSEPVPNEVIPAGQVWQETRRLERVNEMNIRIRADYRNPKTGGLSKWGSKQSKRSGRQVCSAGKVYEVTIN